MTDRAETPPPQALPGRLTRRPDFLAVAKGQRAGTSLFTLQARCGSDAGAPPRLGLTVTKKAGGAVERNRMRRRLREAVRRIGATSARHGHDYVIVARRGILHAGFEALLHDLAGAFRRVHSEPSSTARPKAQSAGAAKGRAAKGCHVG